MEREKGEKTLRSTHFIQCSVAKRGVEEKKGGNEHFKGLYFEMLTVSQKKVGKNMKMGPHQIERGSNVGGL